jgi:hypothetical protein
MADLRFIRDTMASATSYTAFSGWGLAVVGCGAVLTGLIAMQQPTVVSQLTAWLADAGVSAAIGVLWSIRKARVAGQALTAGPIRKFCLSFAPAILAGAVLTMVMLRDTSAVNLLPGIWLLLYGTGLISSGALSVRIIPVIGAGFFALGVLTLIAAPAWANTLLIGGFGGLHIVLGTIIAWRHGG